MRTRLAGILGCAFIAVALSCSQPSSPGDPDPITQSGCVTDFSCPYGEECADNMCASISGMLYSHIQTASALLRTPLDDTEIAWRASHYDLHIGVARPDPVRAVNPNARIFEYMLTRFHKFDQGDKTASDWAIAHGYDPEDFYLHFREDVAVPTWEGRQIVPGYPLGVVPGWNPGADNASATERSHSRVVGYYQGGNPLYLVNATHPGFRRFLVEHVAGLIDGTWYYNTPFATGPVDGIMCDESLYYSIFGEGQLDRTDEFYGVALTENHPYSVAFETLYPELADGLHDTFGDTRDVMPNYGHVLFLNYPYRAAINVQSTTPWIWGEVWVTNTGTSFPTSGGSRCISYEKDYGNAVREIVEQTRARGRRIVGARDTSSGTSGSDRGKLFTLGLYYLVHNAHTYYMYETSAGHAQPGHISTWAWNPAVTFDVGQPDVIPAGTVDFEGKSNTKEHWVFATGPDPHRTDLLYRVLARRFTNALVLVKMLPEGSVDDDRSLTIHALDGTYAVLQADGNPGASITDAQLRNNEALILIPLD